MKSMNFKQISFNDFSFFKNGQKLFKLIIAFTFFLHLIALLSKVSTHSDFVLSRPEEKVIKITFAPSPKSQKRKQVVETEANRGEKVKPLDEAFLGKQDNSVSRQTVAKNIEKFKRAGIGVKDGSKVARTSKGKKGEKKSQKLSLSDLKALKSQNAMKEFKPSSSGAALGLKTGDKNSHGASASNDFVEEIPMGDFTQLNTTEFKFYGFYHRIKQKLEQFWGATIQSKVSKIYKSGRSLASGKNHATSLIIHLDSLGKIIAVKVKGTSGYKELDEAAVESFNSAGPFPNPPKGMVKNGRAVIEWGFVVKS